MFTNRLLVICCCLMMSCLGSDKKKDFNGYPNNLKYTGTLENGKEQSLFKFFNNSDEIIIGNYLDGFRNNKWYYNIEDSLIEIKWAHFKGKNLEFETNIFDFVDTVYYGDYYTQFDYKIGDGIITLGIVINNPSKDSLNLLGYKEIATLDMQKLGFKLNNFDSVNYDKIKVYSLAGINNKGNKIYINTAFGHVDKQHLQISVISIGSIKKRYNEILFEGILTNIYVSSKRFYNPFNASNSR